MFKYTTLCAALLLSLSAHAAGDEDLREIRGQIKQLQEDYQQRMLQLEQRLQQTETASAQPNRLSAGGSTASGEGTFNPAISLILSGTYGQLRQDPALAITGFTDSADNSGYSQGFSLKESELGIAANIDPHFRGVATLALDPEGGLAVENAFVQTLALGHGLNFKMGRYFSGLGYLNEQHAHAWDFVDQPLVYRALWDNQLGEDGIQLKWLAPTDTFVEIGGELGRGRSFPGSDRQRKNGAGSGVLFAHVGDDLGVSSSWLAGISLHQTRRENAVSTVNSIDNSFSGDSKTAGLDFIWKYAPNGNVKETNFKLLGEYFRRKENGQLTYDVNTTNITDSYTVTQSGWYLQGVYQFMPRWRAGLRYDRLDSGTARVGALNAANVVSNYGYTPEHSTLMLEYNPSEFSRFRLQLAQDKSRQGLPDNQLFVQYVMSLGAHGGHQF